MAQTDMTGPAEPLPEASWFWPTPTLNDLVGDTAPFSLDETWEIDDLSDEEWTAFTAALAE